MDILPEGTDHGRAKTSHLGQGHKKLKEEIDRLTRIETPKRDQGDRNSPRARRSFGKRRIYLCQEKQALLETRLRELQDRLASSEIIDVENRPPSDKVIFGSRVTIEDVDTNEKKIYQILGQDDADIGRGIISVDSPVGRALLASRSKTSLK